MLEIGSFKNPELLWLLTALIPLLLWFFVFRHKDRAGFNFSYAPSTKKYNQINSVTILIWKIRPFIFFLRLLGLAALIVSIARPQTSSVSTRTKTTKGIDIVLAIDVSSSMLAKDLKPNRLSALKKVAAEFIGKRPNDRIGLVVYAGESYTKTPVTSDKIIVDRSLQEVPVDRERRYAKSTWAERQCVWDKGSFPFRLPHPRVRARKPHPSSPLWAPL